MLTVTAGVEGRYLVGRRLPVTVAIEADRLVRGTVEVTVDELTGTWSSPIEVPGGSDKEVVVVVPSPAAIVIDRVQVRLVGAGDAVQVDAELEPLEDVELAGLLPAVTPADLPDPHVFPHDVGTASFAALDPEDLAVPGAIDPVGTIVAGPDEIGQLDVASRVNLLDWIDRGGRLVIDGQPGTTVAGLPDPWQPGTTGRARAGLGQIRQSGGRAAAGDWAAVLEPTPTASAAGLPNFGAGGVVVPVGDALAADAGLNALDLPWLLGFLAAYVVLAGPIAYLLLRRRASAGWVAVPLLAVVFTGAAFVVGDDLRSGTNTAHGTVVERSRGVSRATTLVGTVSRNGGDGTATFPAGWTAGSTTNGGGFEFPDDPGFGGDFGFQPAEVAVTTSVDRSAARVPLAAGEFGVMRGSGPVSSDEAGLVVDATSADGAITGTITNQLGHSVEQVGVFIGRTGIRLGDIAAGATTEFEIRGNEFRLGDAFQPAEAAVWPDESGSSGETRTDSVVNLGLLYEAMGQLGVNARPRGIVTVVGWSRSVASPIGGSATLGRSAIVVREPVAANEQQVAPGAARRELLRGPEGIDVPDNDAGAAAAGHLWQFDLPTGTGDIALDVTVPGYVLRLDVWTGTNWVTIDEQAGFNGDFAQIRVRALPTSARRGDTVLLRGLVTPEAGLAGEGIDITGAAA